MTMVLNLAGPVLSLELAAQATAEAAELSTNQKLGSNTVYQYRWQPHCSVNVLPDLPMSVGLWGGLPAMPHMPLSVRSAPTV